MEVKEKKPAWINKKVNFKEMQELEKNISGLNLHTVCHQARCPNRPECFSAKTAAFLIMGDRCTRNCSFCSVAKGIPLEIDKTEPARIVEAIKKLGLKYAVITSVTRDDLSDKGASVFAQCIKQLKNFDKRIKVEVLVPDFMGDEKAIETVTNAGPDVFGHNIETVPSLYNIRKDADYKRSLRVLKYAKERGSETKSSMLLGFGEKEEEVLNVFRDLRNVGCDYMAIGQYLQPDKKCCKVVEYIKPEKFDYYKKEAIKFGFKHVESGVYVRSSYMAEKYVENRIRFELV